MKLIFSLFLVLLSTGTTFAKNRTLFIKSTNAILLEKPLTNSKKVAYLKLGDAVKALTKKGFFIKVKSKKGVGYVSSFMLTKTKPKKIIIDLKEKAIELKNKGRKRASSYTTTAAGRGLRNSKIIQGNSLYSQNLSSLEKLKKVFVPPEYGIRYLNEK